MDDVPEQVEAHEGSGGGARKKRRNAIYLQKGCEDEKRIRDIGVNYLISEIAESLPYAVSLEQEALPLPSAPEPEESVGGSAAEDRKLHWRDDEFDDDAKKRKSYDECDDYKTGRK